jgi:hypothetical protein
MVSGMSFVSLYVWTYSVLEPEGLDGLFFLFSI